MAYDDFSVVQVGTTTNLIANPDFENKTYKQDLSNRIDIESGTAYSLSALVQATGGNATGNWDVRVHYYDSTDTLISESFTDINSATNATVTSIGQVVGGQFITPVNARYMRISLSSALTAGTLSIGDVSLSLAPNATKYYFAGASRVAMRNNGVLTYLLADHLGSTSLVVKASITGVYEEDVVSELRYKAWGEVRYTSGTTPTDYTYTGQYSDMDDFGLMFYNARWYDPYLNHFTQPDSIVPDPANPQSWDRYSYARNNPLRYNDPSGHLECEAESNGSCMNSKKLKLWQYAADTLNELGGKDDLEAVARIVDRAGQLYGTFETMMPALSGIFLGIEESNSTTIYNAATQEDRCAALGRPDCAANSGITFGDAGFHQDFRDLQSQPFHFWAYVATAANTEGVGPASYLPGMVVNAVANVYHEIIQPDGAGATWQDFALAAAGSNIGTLVNIGAIQPNQLGNTIRDHIGGSGPGAFYVDPLIFLLPLEGNR